MINREAASLIPETVARRLNVLGLRVTDESLTVAVADPTNVLATDELKLIVKREVRMLVSEQTAIRLALEQAYGASSGPRPRPRQADAAAPAIVPERRAAGSIDADRSDESAPAIEIVNASHPPGDPAQRERRPLRPAARRSARPRPRRRRHARLETIPTRAPRRPRSRA